MSHKGTVTKWFTAKGFGFLKGVDETEVFVHHTAIQGGGKLTEGGEVYYDIDTSHVPRSKRAKQAADEGKVTACNVSGPGVVERVLGAFSGLVKEWHPGKGYGFIQGTNGATVYVHVSSFEGGSLQEGKTVTFDIEDVGHASGRKVATNVAGPAVLPQGSNTAVVKTWIADKGYGFAEDPVTGKDVYVHAKAIGGGMLLEGREIHYDPMESEHGSGRVQARNVTGPAVRDLRDGETVAIGAKGGKGGKAGKMAFGRMAGGAAPRGAKGGQQKRKDTDGRYYTKEEFVAQYGGVAEWEAAEERPSPINGKMYTKDKFLAHFGGLAEWNAAGAGGKNSRFTPTGRGAFRGRGRGAGMLLVLVGR
eukprot:Sspe_Gene.82111::Locus_53717_Transcript_1_1_Confidence_1.000_Length_1133::g.82111::m.82111